MGYRKKRTGPGSRRKTKSKRKAPKTRAAKGPSLNQVKAFMRAKHEFKGLPTEESE